MADQTINVPQLILILVLGGLAIRYFFFSSSSTSSSQNRIATAANNVRAREADVERIQQMFPQVSRRCIMWDLQRNGGNVVATTERILSGRGLEVVSSNLCFSISCYILGRLDSVELDIYNRLMQLESIYVFVRKYADKDLYAAPTIIPTTVASRILLQLGIHGFDILAAKTTATRSHNTLQSQIQVGGRRCIRK
jgi:hypothetical protein